MIKTLTLIILLLLTACGSNVLYYDPQEKAIKPCGYRWVSYFAIMDASDSSSCTYMAIDGAEANRFYLFQPNHNYKPVSCIGNFSIRPNAKYVIVNRTIRDASTWEMVIEIDSIKNVKQIKPLKRCD